MPASPITVVVKVADEVTPILRQIETAIAATRPAASVPAALAGAFTAACAAKRRISRRSFLPWTWGR
jgi:hypothetical protein